MAERSASGITALEHGVYGSKALEELLTSESGRSGSRTTGAGLLSRDAPLFDSVNASPVRTSGSSTSSDAREGVLGIEAAARWHGREYFSGPQEKTLAEPGALEGG